MNEIFGISLGSTQACIARLDRYGRPEVIRNQTDASSTLPTAIFFESADNVVIGNSAKDMAETDPERVVQFSHRELGKPSADKYTFDGKEYSVEEINALFLARLKMMAEEQGYNVKDIILAIPAYFGLEEKCASKRICELADLHLLRIITEPVAAAISYLGRKVEKDQNILVYDLGGGTFDLSILKVTANNDKVLTEDSIQIIATNGNDFLGGKDWDEKIFDYILQSCCDENGLYPEEIDIETRQIIRSRIETVKKKLSNLEQTRIKVFVNGCITNINITRKDFENMTEHMVFQTMTYVEDILQRVGNIEIDTVLLVGGSSYMPMIRNAVENRFPGKVQVMDPDQAIAQGAAVYGGMLLGLSFENTKPKTEELKPKETTQGGPQTRKSIETTDWQSSLKKDLEEIMIDPKWQKSSKEKSFLAKLLKYALEHFLGDLTGALIEALDFKSCTVDELFLITVILHRHRKSNFHIEGLLENNCISSVVATDIGTGQKFVYTLSKRFGEKKADSQLQNVSLPIEVAYARKQMEYVALATDEFNDKFAVRILDSIPWEKFSSPEIAYILRGAHSFFQSNGAKEDCLKVKKWESKLELT